MLEMSLLNLGHNKENSDVGVVNLGKAMIFQWRSVREEDGSHILDAFRRVNLNETWKKPALEWLKANIDTASFNDAGLTSLACVVRDHCSAEGSVL